MMHVEALAFLHNASTFLMRNVLVVAHGSQSAQSPHTLLGIQMDPLLTQLSATTIE